MGRIFFMLAFLLGAFISQLFAQSKIEKCFYEGQYKDVLQLLKEKAERGNLKGTELELAARSCEQLFDYESSVSYWKQAFQFDSSNTRAIAGIADGFNNLGKYRDALSYYRLILPSDTSDVVFWGKYAGVLSNLELDAQAAGIYEALLKTEPANLFLIRKLASALYSMKNYSRAKDCLLKYCDLNPGDLSMQLALATCFQRLEKDNEAVEVLERVISVDSTQMTAMNKLAYINYNNLRNYEKAVVWYRKVNFLEGNSDSVHLTNQGICEYFTGNHEFSANLLDSLAYVNTSDPFVWFYAGMSYRKLGEIDKALSFLETASKFAIPAYTADIYHHLGRVYSLKRMFKEAIAAYEKTREIDSSNSLVYYDLALAHEEMSRNSTLALAYYQQFAKENSDRPSAELDYALGRIKKIKEEQFFEGK